MKHIKTFESLNTGKTPWDIVNSKAEELFGEFGISTCTDDQVSKLIDIKKADKIAEKIFGEFGFLTCSVDEQERIINENPTLLK